MKVYSLYYKGTFMAALPNREDAIALGKMHYGDDAGWDCNIVEEYLSKTPYNNSPYTPLTTPSQPIPYTPPPTITKPPARYPDSFPHIYCDGSAPKANDL
jgi:hypothetical protein